MAWRASSHFLPKNCVRREQLPTLVNYFLIAAAIGIFIAAAMPRFFYPYEAHWGEGSMLYQVQRILDHKPLYGQPTIQYVAWLYEPIYYYLSASIASIAGISFISDRIISLVATIALLIIIYKVIRHETKSMYLGIGGIGLFIAAYGKTGYCMVVARIDPLFVLLLVICFVAVYYSKSFFSLVIGGLLFSLCCFTKQTALLFLPAICLYLWKSRSMKEMLSFVISCVICFALVFFLFHSVYDNWFVYYTIKIPQGKAHFLRWGHAMSVLVTYVITRCWFIAASMLIVSFFLMKKQSIHPASFLFASFFASALAAGFIGILYQGGENNVLLPAAAGSALFIPLIVHDFSISNKFPKIRQWIIPLQIAFLISIPWRDKRNITTENDKKNQDSFYRYVSSLSGEIWIPFHVIPERLTGKKSYAEYFAVHEAIDAGDSASENLHLQFDTALVGKYWDFILSDLKENYTYYHLIDSIGNLNKVHLYDDTNLYIYVPDTSSLGKEKD